MRRLLRQRLLLNLSPLLGDLGRRRRRLRARVRVWARVWVRVWVRVRARASGSGLGSGNYTHVPEAALHVHCRVLGRLELAQGARARLEGGDAVLGGLAAQRVEVAP